MNKTITEYTITFEDIDEEDFITEDKQEADAKIEELKDNGEFYKVYQYYAKDWVYNDETGDWEESDVEVYYTKGEDEELEESSEIPMYIDEYYPTRQEAKAAEKVLKQQGRKTKVERHGNEYILWTSYEKVEEAKEKEYEIALIPEDLYKVLLNIQEMYQEDLLNSDEDIFADEEDSYAVEMLYNHLADIITTPEYREYRNKNYTVKNPDGIDMKVDTDLTNAFGAIIRDDKLSEYKLQETKVESKDIIQYNIYVLLGEDGEYISSKVDTVETEEQAIDRVSELKAETGNGAYYTKVVNGKELDEAKSSNNEYEIEYAIPNYTGGNVYVFTGKLKNGNYFLADDTFTPFDTRILDIDPNTTIKDENGIEVTLMDDVSLQDKHLVKDLDENDAKEFTLNLVKWIEENKPDGNYQVDEIKATLEVKKTEAVDNVNVNETIQDLISQINKWFENNKIDKVVLYKETPNYGIVSTNVLDKELYDKYNTTAYETEDEQVFNQDGFGYEVIKYLENYLKTLKNNKVTEAVDNTQKQEDEKEEIEQQEEIIDTTKELEEGIKKEIYQYAKQQGLDIEKLRKQGIELETLEETLDTVIGNMVSKSAIEYMDKTGKDITWDFEVSGNDIKIIWNEV